MIHRLVLLGSLVLTAAPLHAQIVAHALDTPTPRAFGFFGGALAGTTDLDGDDRGDLLVGASGEGVNPDGAGHVHVLSGATGALLYTLSSANAETNGGFGRVVAGLPDVDGDGRADIAVGASTEDRMLGGDLINAAGRAYVHSGADGTLLYQLVSPNPTAGGAFSVVAAVPDLDGDGVADVVVGALGEDLDGANAGGRAYVFSGASGALVHTLVSPAPTFSGRFGAAVAGLADVDGDGRGDVLVGAWGEDVVVPGPLNRADAGRAHLFSGATGALLRTLVSPEPERLGYFGGSLAAIDDADGDGVPDIAVGALNEDVAGITDAGRVHVFSGASGTFLFTLVSPNPTATGLFGETVAGVPDADGDGRGDVLANAYPEDGFAGRAYLFSGATGARLATLTGAVAGGAFGEGIAGVPDADGDGLGDVLVGAPREDVGGVARVGRTYLIEKGGGVGRSPGPEAVALTVIATPNPARSQATFAYVLDRSGPARLAVYDALGREVAVVVGGDLPAGRGEAALDVARLAPGVYLARLDVGGRVATARLVVVR